MTFDDVLNVLSDWYEKDQEDTITLSRYDVITLLEGIQATRCKCPPVTLDDVDHGC